MNAIISFFKSIFRSIFGGNAESAASDLPWPDTIEEATPATDPPVKEEVSESAPPKTEEVATGNTGSYTFVADADPETMVVDVFRYSTGKHDTLGKLYIQGEEYAYTLENPTGNAHTPDDSRIPAGTYELAFRTEGGRHPTYLYRFGEIHKGMLWLKEVAGYPFALICIGNKASDTHGSLLVGTQVQQETDTDAEREVWYSEQAYRKVYPIIADHLAAGKPVKLHIR